MTTSIERNIAKSVSWFGLFKLGSQAFSWVVTIAVAKILMPEDYGLMAMSSILTGYAEMFNELGLANAIIQKKDVTQRDISSVFWFSVGVSLVLAASCFPLAHLTAFIMHDPRVIPLTMTASVIFLTNGLQIIPMALIKRDLGFKKLGGIELFSTIFSCAVMYVLARTGVGVWTLILGRIARSVICLFLVYWRLRWFPALHFQFSEAKAYLRFGIIIALGRSLFYLWEKSDRFFAGRVWTSQLLGYYTFALQLAQLPTEKIVNLINQVSFPALARVQGSVQEFNRLYLNITKVTALLVLPMFLMGFFLGDSLIRNLLNEKWFSTIPLFRYLCLSQIFLAMNAINNQVHTAQGRPGLSLLFNFLNAIVMPVSFFVAVPYGLHAMIFPWLGTYTLVCIGWTLMTIRFLGIPLLAYCQALSAPVLASATMSLVVCGASWSMCRNFSLQGSMSQLLITVASGLFAYWLHLWLFNRSLLANIRGILSPTTERT